MCGALRAWGGRYRRRKARALQFRACELKSICNISGGEVGWRRAKYIKQLWKYTREIIKGKSFDDERAAFRERRRPVGEYYVEEAYAAMQREPRAKSKASAGRLKEAEGRMVWHIALAENIETRARSNGEGRHRRQWQTGAALFKRKK